MKILGILLPKRSYPLLKLATKFISLQPTKKQFQILYTPNARKQLLKKKFRIEKTTMFGNTIIYYLKEKP